MTRRIFLNLTVAALMSTSGIAKRPTSESLYGVITLLGDGILEIAPPGTENRRRFQIGAQTQAVPSEIGVRVGSRVRVEFRRDVLLLVEVIPFGEWLKLFPDVNRDCDR